MLYLTIALIIHQLITDILILWLLHIVLFPFQDINTPCIVTNNIQEFQEAESTQFETVFVLTDFDSPDYSYLYKRDNRIVGPPVVLHCAVKKEVSY